MKFSPSSSLPSPTNHYRYRTTKNQELSTAKRNQEPPLVPMPNHLIANDSPLAFNEFVMRVGIPLSQIHHIVFSYLKDRKDIAIFGAQAVNAYVDEFRMTQDVDVMALDAELLATSIRDHLHQELKIAARVSSVANGQGFRVYQVQKPKNRRLVDVRQIEKLPDYELNDGIQVVAPLELIALKVISMSARLHTPKGLTDHADLMRLLLTYPIYKKNPQNVAELLGRHSANLLAQQVWQEIATEDFQANDDDEY